MPKVDFLKDLEDAQSLKIKSSEGLDRNPLIKSLYQSLINSGVGKGELKFSFVIDDEKWNLKVNLEKVEI